MRMFFSTLFAILLGVIFIAFAVANRDFVTVSFGPIASVSMPLFALIIAVAILGVIAGGMATWFGQRRWRRAARQHEADARTAKAQLAELRSQALASRAETQRLALPARDGFFASSGRDKQGAAL